MGRIVVPDQPGQKVCETPSQQKKVVCSGACLRSQPRWEILNRRISVQAGLGEKKKKKQDPISKISRAKMAGGRALA
jgi:hypothetical protein